MGFGIPAAIGARIAVPECPVVCVTGDGGFLMACGELVTARRLNLDIVIIVLADKELNLIKLKEEARNVQPIGIDLYDDHLFKSDVFLGVPVLRCNTSKQLSKAIPDALSEDGPVIIEMVLDPEEYKDLIII